MHKLEKLVYHMFSFLGDVANGLDSTGWAVLATVTVIAGWSLLKGPGIRGA